MPGIQVTIQDAPPSASVPSDTGTLFAVGVTGSGTAASPVLRQNMVQYKDEFGDRAGGSLLWDAIESFFAEGGSRAYIAKAATAAEADYLAALDSFSIHLGPGQVAAPGVTAAATHTDLLEHAEARNRRALLDAVDTQTVATLTTAATNAGSGDARRYGARWGNWPVIQGVTSGTTRTVPPSGVIAGMIARADRQRPQAAAGAQVLPRTVIDVAKSFTDAEVDTLADGNVNVFHEFYGTLQNFGWRSLAAKSTEPGWWQFTASRLVMAIIAKALVVSNRYLFSVIDGQRKALGRFEGELAGEAFMPFYLDGVLYGATPAEAFSVDVVSTQANPDADLAEGNVKAVCAVRPSPFAENVNFTITNVPITQPLAA